MNIYGLRTCLVLALATATAACGLRPLAFDGPNDKAEIHWLGSLVTAQEQQPLHIIYVHGIRAEGPGFSKPFRKALLARLPKGTPAPEQLSSHTLPMGDQPTSANYLGKLIWAKDGAWPASQPFVDRYIFKPTSGRQVIVDEVNWWPLAFPLKCQFLLAPESRLAGADVARLKLCANDPVEARKRGGRYFAWIEKEELDTLLSHRPVAGGTPLGNRKLKQEIMDWGLSDAVIALGPMRHYLRMTMDKAFDYADQGGENDQFVVVSESLGSFIVMDAYERSADGKSKSRTAEVLDKTTDLYFFANQFALLELARISGLPDSFGLAPDDTATPRVSPLQQWATPATASLTPTSAPARRQVVAFSDPSDALTYYLPCDAVDRTCKSPTTKVLNVYDQNALHWLGLLENPAKAHVGHTTNDKVLDQLFSNQAPSKPPSR